MRRRFVGSIFAAAAGSNSLSRANSADTVRLCIDLGSDCRPLPGEFEVVDHRSVVQPGAAHEQRTMSTLADRVDGRCVRHLELGHGEVVRRFDEVDQVVRNLGLLRGDRLRRADVHTPIHLHAVDRDQLHVAEPAGNGHGHGGLTRRRRADEGDSHWRTQKLFTLCNALVMVDHFGDDEPQELSR